MAQTEKQVRWPVLNLYRGFAVIASMLLVCATMLLLHSIATDNNWYPPGSFLLSVKIVDRNAAYTSLLAVVALIFAQYQHMTSNRGILITITRDYKKLDNPFRTVSIRNAGKSPVRVTSIKYALKFGDDKPDKHGTQEREVDCRDAVTILENRAKSRRLSLEVASESGEVMKRDRNVREGVDFHLFNITNGFVLAPEKGVRLFKGDVWSMPNLEHLAIYFEYEDFFGQRRHLRAVCAGTFK